MIVGPPCHLFSCIDMVTRMHVLTNFNSIDSGFFCFGVATLLHDSSLNSKQQPPAMRRCNPIHVLIPNYKRLYISRSLNLSWMMDPSLFLFSGID
ncbi:hypothetical protein GIB67_033397 [Kingdonia uniflora]|uniref:Uncharacterized protein n=1 Tax=Kingdonia uniflora TaxID=39325 RepID=A0A7J7LU06_9MAGN|nr:hypothetical protein GIB67_033397 [Kingdonia uniflora]